MSCTESCVVNTKNKLYIAYQTKYRDVITDIAQEILDYVTIQNMLIILSVKGTTYELARHFMKGKYQTSEICLVDLAKPKFLGMIAYKKCYVLYSCVSRQKVQPSDTKIIVVDERNPNKYTSISNPTRADIMDWITQSLIEDHDNEDAVHQIPHCNGLLWKHI